jgi:putative aldouronate transport system substrate-binding protein
MTTTTRNPAPVVLLIDDEQSLAYLIHRYCQASKAIMNRTRSVFLTLVLMLSVLLAACGGQAPQQAAATAAPQQAAATTAPQAAEPTAAPQPAAATAAAQPAEATAAPASASAPVKITVFAPQGEDVDLATNSLTKELEQKFNIQFEWQTTTYDGASAKEKRQISLASGDFPDLYLLIPWVDQFSQTDLLKFSQQGVVLPLNDLIDQYAPNIKAALEKYPYFKAMASAPDGKIYGIPQLIECYHCSYPNKMWLNSKWLKKLNLSAPKTTDDFKAALEAFKTKDPNGNGKADEVALSGSIEEYGVRVLPFLMNGFIYDDDRTYLLLKDGKADAELIGASAAMHPAIFVQTGTDSKYGSDYDAIPPLQGPRAKYATYNYPSAPGATFVLTSKASQEAQIAAIKVVDYFFTEDGQIRGNFGEEGKDWRKPQAGDVAVEKDATPLVARIPGKDGEPPHNSSWGALAQYFQPKTFRDRWVQGTDIYASDGFERRLQEATHLYDGKQPKEVFPHWAVWIDPAIADEVATLRTNITSFVDQNALQFVTGAKDLDKDWDAYVAELDQLGLPRYLEIVQQSYDKSSLK